MPQISRGSSRQEGKLAQRAIEKEQKRSRGAMSCAECRRLKLKCDKTVPCSSCKRRGCSAICPNGSLITGQGTRFVLADTEKLHNKIAKMSDRIRQLEDALAVLQSTLSQEHHPLLHRDLLEIKSIIELHAAVNEDQSSSVQREEEEESDQKYIDSFGTLAIRDDGAATFYGPSAGSESLLVDEESGPPPAPLAPTRGDSRREAFFGGLGPGTNHLASSFPLPLGPGSSIDLMYLIDHHLPSWSRAHELCNLYLEQAPWFFGAVTKCQLIEEILPLWYAEAADLIPPGSIAPLTGIGGTDGPASSNSKIPETPAKGAHELALLFVIFCFGALTDMTSPPAPDNEEAERYYQLTRAALTLEPILDRPPSVATVQTLSLMAIYQGLCSGENSIESTWGMFGLSTKLAQSLGLHRDCARWKLPPAEVQKRRALFWELFITDCWQSLATGRLATFSLPFVDCELPSDPDQTLADDGTIQPSFPAWKAQFGAQCVSAVVQGALTAKVPKYSVIVELDRKIRDMELPKYAQGPPPQGAGLAETMRHFMPHNYRHLKAVQSSPHNPMKSPYAPSFLAGYRSACELLNSLKSQFTMFPEQIARFWVLWTHAFSSAVMLASVVTHAAGNGTRSKLTSAALLELRMAVELFQIASGYGGRAVKFLPILQRLLKKADESYNNCSPTAGRNDIFMPSKQGERKDELSIFSGQAHTVATKSKSLSSSSRSSRYSPQTSDTSSPHSTSSDTSQPKNIDLHPTLVDQWNMFDGDLNTQIYRAEHAYSSHTEMIAHPSMDGEQQMASSHFPYQYASQLDHPQAYHSNMDYTYTYSQEQQPVYNLIPNSSISYAQHATVPIYHQTESYQDIDHNLWQNIDHRLSSQHQGQLHSELHQVSPEAVEQLVNLGSLQETWQSFVYTVGSPRAM